MINILKYILESKISLVIMLLVFLCMNHVFGQLNLRNDLQNARNTFHKTHFEEADRLFKSFENKVMDDPLLYAYKSMIDYMLFRPTEENTEKTKQYLKENNPDYYFIKAFLRFIENDFKEATELLETHVSKYQNDSYAKQALGFTRNDNGQPKVGLKILLELIDDDPSYFPAYNHIGYAYMALNNLDNATIYFGKFVERDILNPSAYDSYAEGLAEKQNYDLAISQLTKAILLDESFAYAWKHMGDIFLKMNKPVLAVNAYTKAKENSHLYGKRFVESIEKKISLARNLSSVIVK